MSEQTSPDGAHVTQSPLLDAAGNILEAARSAGDAAHAAGQELSDMGVAGPNTIGN
jgi:hypothetical protein